MIYLALRKTETTVWKSLSHGKGSTNIQKSCPLSSRTENILFFPQMKKRKSTHGGCCTNQQVSASYRFVEAFFEIQGLNAEDTVP